MDGGKQDLCGIVKEQILAYIGRMDLTKNNRIPSENQLAARLQVSRSTVRTVLATLEDEGKVFRRHGSGTYVNQAAFSLKTTLYPHVYFYDLIRLSGYKPTIELLSVVLRPAGEVSTWLNISPADKVAEVRKIYRANEEMCIYCIDHLDARVLDEKKLEALKTEQISIFQFLLRYTELRMSWDMVRLIAINSADIPELSDYARPNQSYLLVESINYDAQDKPALYSLSYMDSELIKYYIVRGGYSPETNDLTK